LDSKTAAAAMAAAEAALEASYVGDTPPMSPTGDAPPTGGRELPSPDGSADGTAGAGRAAGGGDDDESEWDFGTTRVRGGGDVDDDVDVDGTVVRPDAGGAATESGLDNEMLMRMFVGRRLTDDETGAARAGAPLVSAGAGGGGGGGGGVDDDSDDSDDPWGTGPRRVSTPEGTTKPDPDPTAGPGRNSASFPIDGREEAATGATGAAASSSSSSSPPPPPRYLARTTKEAADLIANDLTVPRLNPDGSFNAKGVLEYFVGKPANAVDDEATEPTPFTPETCPWHPDNVHAHALRWYVVDEDCNPVREEGDESDSDDSSDDDDDDSSDDDGAAAEEPTTITNCNIAERVRRMLRRAPPPPLPDAATLKRWVTRQDEEDRSAARVRASRERGDVAPELDARADSDGYVDTDEEREEAEARAQGPYVGGVIPEDVLRRYLEELEATRLASDPDASSSRVRVRAEDLPYRAYLDLGDKNTDNVPLDALHETDRLVIFRAYCVAAEVPVAVAEKMAERRELEIIVRCLAWHRGVANGASVVARNKNACVRLRRAVKELVGGWTTR
jgi:hypothetical protein